MKAISKALVKNTLLDNANRCVVIKFVVFGEGTNHKPYYISG